MNPHEAPAARARMPAEIWVRRALLVVALSAALTAVLAGLARLGVFVAWGPRFTASHGPLFVLGVFGTVISLERAVALARPAALVAPASGAAAAVAMLAGLTWAPWAALVQAAALAAINVAIVRRQSAAFTWLMLAGSCALFVGNVAWVQGRALFSLVPAWIAFFVLTIVAERLELSRLAPTPRWASRLLVALAVIAGLGACGALVSASEALRVFGGALAALGAWQLRFDLARRTVRQPGLPRFSAVNVLAGAAWLVVTGAVIALVPHANAGPLYDAALHGVFVGYVLSMVLAHAPIILPAVARISIPFHPLLWAAPVLLHAALVARMVGDLAGVFTLRHLGSIGNAVALAVFALSVFSARALTAQRARSVARAAR